MPRWQLGVGEKAGLLGVGAKALCKGLRPGPQRPVGLYVAYVAPTLYPELRFWVGFLPVPVLGPPGS